MIRRIFVLIIIITILIMTAQAIYAADWYNASWKYRQKITISSSMTNSDLSNFPTFIKITDQNNPIFGKTQSSGDDILFTSSDGTAKLSHEIEKYTDSGTKELDAWIKL